MDAQRISADELLVHAAGLRRLAGRLVADASDADDLVQATLVAGLERPPRSEQPLAAWLARVLRNFATERWRTDSNRVRRERAAARGESAPSEAELVERMELHRAVADEVLALPDPYRKAILSLYFDDVRAEEHARSLGIPVATVRTHVRRGIELLRERLDARSKGDRSAWMSGLAAIARVPSPEVSASALGALSLGGLLMSKLAIGAIALVVVIAVAVKLEWPSSTANVTTLTAQTKSPTLAAVEKPKLDPVTPPNDEHSRVAAAPVASSEAIVDGVLVTVVEKGTNAPVADAIVRWLDSGSAPKSEIDSVRTQAQLDRALVRLGRTFKTDAEGHVTVPRFVKDGRLTAEKGNEWGEAESVFGPRKKRTIEIFPDVSLRVQVFDSDRKPRGGVGVRVLDLKGEHFDLSDAIVGLTDAADGIALLPHVAWMMRKQSDRELVVAVDGVFAEPLEQTLSLDHWPNEPVRFDLPPTGSVQVLVRDGLGKPDANRKRVELGLDRDDVWNSRWRRRGNELCFASCETRAGIAEFPLVGLNLALRAEALIEPPQVALEVRGVGPIRAGELVKLDVGGPTRIPVLRIRAVDLNSAPIRNTQLHVVTRISNAKRATGQITEQQTDGNGVFALTLIPEWRVGWHRWFDIELDMRSDSDAPSAAFELDRDLELGVNDLGDVMLTPTPLIASGRVVDDDHRPIADAPVCAFRMDGGPGSDPFLGSPELGGLPTRADGRFELRGRLERKETAIYIEDHRYLPSPPVRVALGTKDLEIVLHSPSNFIGYMTLDPGVDERAVEVVALQPSTAEIRANVVKSIARPGATEFQFGKFAAGVYDFAFRLRGGEELAIVRAAGVTPGEHDARLDCVDLAGRINVFQVHVVDANDQPIAKATLVSRAAGSNSMWAKYDIEQGLATCFSISPRVDLCAFAPGLRTVALSSVDHDLTLRLVAGYPVRAKLASSSLVPPDAYRLSFVLTAKSPFYSGASEHPQATGMFASDGTALAVASDAGIYDLMLKLAPVGPESRHVWSWLRSPTPSTVEIRDEGGEQSIEIAFDTATLDAAIEELDKLLASRANR